MNEAQQTKKPAAGYLLRDIANDVENTILNITQMPDPDTVLEQAGYSRAELRKLEGDDEIAAALETRYNACVRTPWRLEGVSEEITGFVQEQLDAHYERIISGAWAAVPYGYSVLEAIYANQDNRITWGRIEERNFEWFDPKPDGELRYFPRGKAGGVDGVKVDTVFKFFLTRRKPTQRNPKGESVLSRAFWPWKFRTEGWGFWARYLERYGSPLLIGKTAGDTTAMADMLAKAVNSATAAIDKDDEVNAISSGGSGESFDRFDKAVNRRIQKVILGQTLTTEVDGKGSYAAAKVHDDVRNDRRLADITLASKTIQRMINALVALNWPAAEPPQFVMEDMVGLETARAERDAKLATAGIVRFKKEYLTRAYDFDPDDIEVMDQAAEQGTTAGAAQAATGVTGLMLADGAARLTPAQQAVDDLADQALDKAGQPVPITKIKAAIRAAKSPDDLRDRLFELFDEHDTSQFREILERALFAADLLGYAHMEGQNE